MTVQEPSAAIIPTPLERRARRAYVADLLTSGLGHSKVTEIVAEKYGVSVRWVWNDIRLVRRRWDAEESKRSGDRRTRQVRALERNAQVCYATGDMAGERDARWKIGKLLGMGNPAPVVPPPASTNILILTKSDAEVDALLAGVARRAIALGMLQVEAPAVPVETNGAHTNGHAKNGNGHA